MSLEKDSAPLWTTTADGQVKLRRDPTCSQAPITIHQMFLESLEKYKSLNALASKKEGKWEKITFSEYYRLSWKAAKSFLKLGLERFHSVAILGFNSAEWFISAVGAVFAGGIVSGIYTTSSPEACHYIAHDCRANIVVVENQKQLDKIMQVRNLLLEFTPLFENVSLTLMFLVYVVIFMDEFMELGNEIPDGQLDAIINSQEANQCCVLIYTSGTTGKPKGVMLSHDNITWTSAHASRAGDVQPAEVQQEKIVSYLPLSHIAGQMCDLWTGIKWGEEVYFAQPDALKGGLVEVLREALPTSQMGVPRVWEKMMEKIKEASSQTGLLKRKMLSWAMSATLEQNLSCSNSCGKVVPGCHVKIVNEDEDSHGEICFWGRNVFMGYLNMEDKTREVIDQDGWLHSGDLGKMDQDGFVYVTGRIKGGAFLCCILKFSRCFGWKPRMTMRCIFELNFDVLYFLELIITAGGENIPPIPLEEAVRKELPLISNAVLIGDQKKFLSMLLTLKCSVDPDTSEPTDCLTQEARDFCQKAGSKATRVSEIVQSRDRAVYRAVQDGIERVNSRSASNPQRIQKWAILGKDFSISGGEFGEFMVHFVGVHFCSELEV
ncbi:Long-chain-fatty-acid--CoA ligase ACSBG1, partial [Ophiophagus hannah]